MDRIRGQITKPVLIGAGVGALVGLLLGLLFAWGVWPVQWTDQPVSKLRPDLQQDYLVAAVQSFAATGNAPEAQRRWAEMGDNKNDLLGGLQKAPPSSLNVDAINRFAVAVQAAGLPGLPPQATLPAGATPGATVTAAPRAGASNTLTVVLVILCLLTLLIGGLFAYLFLVRNRRPGIAKERSSSALSSSAPIAPTTFPEGQEPPIVQYLTTYNMGNDLYDDSFSIDSPSGEFLGECGVGISETIGVGDPKKVTAFEVWLFDKNDIQTVTKVLMSEHAFNDPAVLQRLSSKGEPVLARQGETILLETATLQLEATVMKMNFGTGAMPQNSFFEQMTLRLDVWQKSQ